MGKTLKATVHNDLFEIPPEIVDYWDRYLQKKEIPEYFSCELDYIFAWLYATQKYAFSMQDMKEIGFTTGVLLSDEVSENQINNFDTTKLKKGNNPNSIFQCFDRVIEISSKSIQVTIT